MASVTVKADVGLDTQQLLDSLVQLNTLELEAFYRDIGRLLESRKNEQVASLLFSAVEGAEDSSLPIVEKLIPTSITLDGDSLRF